MSLSERASEEALLERADENNQGLTNLKLMSLLEDTKKENTEKGC